jgi:hypothetical protein
MTKANYSLRLQPSLKKEAERLAAADGASLNQFINVAVAEKLSAMETATYFQNRSAKGKREAFLSFLDGAGDEAPIAGDVIA